MSVSFLAILLTSIATAEAGLKTRSQVAFNPAIVPGAAHPAYLDLDTGASLAAYEYGNLGEMHCFRAPLSSSSIPAYPPRSNLHIRSIASSNLFIFIGGLFDGLFTLPYTPYLGHNLTNWVRTPIPPKSNLLS